MTTPQTNWKFSPSTLEMYFLGVHDVDALPDDCVDVTDERRAELADEMAGGKVFGADARGNPIAVAPPPLDPAAQWLLNQRLARQYLTRSDVTVLRCYEAGVPVPELWASRRQAWRAIVSAADGDPSQTPLPPYPDEFPVAT